MALLPDEAFPHIPRLDPHTLGVDPHRIAHVYPRYTRPHDTEGFGERCWCDPRIEIVGLNGGCVVVHNEEN